MPVDAWETHLFLLRHALHQVSDSCWPSLDLRSVAQTSVKSSAAELKDVKTTVNVICTRWNSEELPREESRGRDAKFNCVSAEIYTRFR